MKFSDGLSAKFLLVFNFANLRLYFSFSFSPYVLYTSWQALKDNDKVFLDLCTFLGT